MCEKDQEKEKNGKHKQGERGQATILPSNRLLSLIAYMFVCGSASLVFLHFPLILWEEAAVSKSKMRVGLDAGRHIVQQQCLGGL